MLNSGQLNDYAINDPGAETADFELAADTTLSEIGLHQHIQFGLAIGGGYLTTSTPHTTVVFGLGLEVTPELVFRSASVRFDWALDMTPRSRTLPKQSIEFDWAIEHQGNQLIPPFLGTEFGIAASTATNVIGQTGSAIYSKWQQRSIKEVRVNRHFDRHEQSAADEEATRHAWDLEVQLSASQIAAHWTFIQDHFGLGKPFYFYDLENNGFIYDASGVITTGRYLVRFSEEHFPRIQSVGGRFSLSYSVIEVE